MRAPVEQVIRTGAQVLEGTLDCREAVTILATLARDAVPAGGRLRNREPALADSYQELLAAIGRELRDRVDAADQARHLQAVVDDLAKVERSLEPPTSDTP